MNAVWAEKYLNDKNIELVFKCEKQLYGDCVITVLTSATFDLYVNGERLGVGPKRTAEGYVSENDFNFTSNGKTQIIIRAVHYGISSYSHFNQAPFFACEVKNDGKIIAETYDFSCWRSTSRVQKVERYSCQRNFLEYYIYKNPNTFFCEENGESVALTSVKLPKIIAVDCPTPTLDYLEIDNCIDNGNIYLKEEFYDEIIPPYARVASPASGYFDNELEVKLSSEASQMGFESLDCVCEDVISNGYKLFELPVEKTGYFNLEINALTDCEVYYIFDEIIPTSEELATLPGGEYFKDKYPVAFNRFTAVNMLKYKVSKGEYKLLSIEPYSFKYVRLCIKGRAQINKFGLDLCENGNVNNFSFKIVDKKTQAVVDSAINTFAQNSLDIFMDCPSRERAGWLCDSFFTARAEKLLTGYNLTEKAFLNNYLIAPPSANLPPEMFPMCYPATFLSGNYIPNWAMWLIIELEDYITRTGDKVLPEKFRDKVFALLEFFKKYENEYGLLEKLDKWIFVEWSDSNKYVRDVNYPTNMLYSYALKVAGKLYNQPDFTLKAENIKKEIIRQSFNGEFFVDRANRIDGKLIVQNEITETCQYYAIFFNIADGEDFSAFRAKMFNMFGQSKRPYANVSPSNAFIGNFLRLECLSRYGLVDKLYEECIEAFSYMAERTGTLWENKLPTASCNHGFSSYVTCLIVRALTGYMGVDKDGLVVLSDNYCKYDCSVILPVGDNKIHIEIKDGKRLTF